MYMSVFNNNELIMYQEDGKIMSGGYTVNSILMNSGKSPLNTYHYGGSKSLESKYNIDDYTNKTHNEFKEDQNTDNIFKDLAVPIGIFYINNDYIRNLKILQTFFQKYNIIQE